MGLGKGRAVMHQLHFLTGDVDQLVVLWVQRANLEEAVLGELAQGNQPLAIGFAGFTQRGVDVSRLVLHIELLLDVVDLLALIGAYRVGHAPLDHLAVDEQRGVGVAATVEGGVQWAQAQLWLTDDGVARVLNLVGKQVRQLGDFDHRYGRRQLAVGNEILAIRGGVATVRVLRHRDVAGKRAVLLAVLATIQHRHLGVAQGDELAGLDRFLRGVDIEHHDPVALVAHHAAEIVGLFRVVAGGRGETPGVVGIGVIEVAVDDDLEGHLHFFGVDDVVHGVAVLILQIEDLAIVGMGDNELGVGVHILGVGHFLQTQAVDRLAVRNGQHLVALHDIQTDTRDAGVGLVVDKYVLAVVFTINHGDVRVVAVAVEELGAVAHDRAAFVGQTPAGGGVDVEHRNTHQLAHGRQAQHAHFTLVTTAPEADVVVQLARGDVDLQLGLFGRSCPGLTAHHRTAQRRGADQGSARCGAGTEETATAQAACFGL